MGHRVRKQTGIFPPQWRSSRLLSYNHNDPYLHLPTNRTTKYCAYSLSIPVSFPIATRCCGRDPSNFEPENLKDL